MELYHRVRTLTCGSDYTGDCTPDLLWWNGTNGQVRRPRGLGNGSFSGLVVALATVADTNWRMVGSADFNLDGAGDVIWRNTATGDTAVWFMSLAEYLGAADLGRVTDQNWIVAGAADFSGDGRVDLLWHNVKTGDMSLWLLNGTTYTSAVLLPRVADVNWQVVGVGAFGGPAGPDVLWRNAQDGRDGGVVHERDRVLKRADIFAQRAGRRELADRGDARSRARWR